jgi:fengycin family lipopeptide synthetase D
MTVDLDEILLHSRYVKQKEYWLEKLMPGMAVTELLSDYNRHHAAINANEMKKVTISVPDTCCQQLLKFSKHSDISIYIALLTVLKILIYRYTGTLDISVLSPVYRANVSNMTLSRHLILRNEIPPAPGISFIQLLFNIRPGVFDAWENQDYPLEKLPEGFMVTRVACVMENIHDGTIHQELADKLVFSFIKEDNSIAGHILYHPDVYSPHYLENIPGYFTRLLEHALENVETNILELPLLSMQEKEQLIFKFNSTDSPYPQDKPIHQLFVEQVEKTPDHIALVGQIPIKAGTRGLAPLPINVTYRELNQKSHQLAHLLIEKGTEPGSIVGIMMECSIEMVIGILGILKAGAAYLPLDPDYPEERIQYILTDRKIVNCQLSIIND